MHPDWWCRKDYAVLKAVEVFGTVRGRKALHKILYFANLKTHTFKYQWYRYGPYSPDLVYKIADHVSDGSLDVKKGGRGGKTRYDMSLSSVGRRMLKYGSYDEVGSAIGWVRRLLGDMSPREMELMASVHYLVWRGHARGEVHGVIHESKPESGFTEAEVEKALQFLEGRGLLEPAQAAGATDLARVPA